MKMIICWASRRARHDSTTICDTGDTNLIQAAASSFYHSPTHYEAASVLSAPSGRRPPVVLNSISLIMHSNTVEMDSPALEINSCNFICWHHALTCFFCCSVVNAIRGS